MTFLTQFSVIRHDEKNTRVRTHKQPQTKQNKIKQTTTCSQPIMPDLTSSVKTLRVCYHGISAKAKSLNDHHSNTRNITCYKQWTSPRTYPFLFLNSWKWFLPLRSWTVCSQGRSWSAVWTNSESFSSPRPLGHQPSKWNFKKILCSAKIFAFWKLVGFYCDRRTNTV